MAGWGREGREGGREKARAGGGGVANVRRMRGAAEEWGKGERPTVPHMLYPRGVW